MDDHHHLNYVKELKTKRYVLSNPSMCPTCLSPLEFRVLKAFWNPSNLCVFLISVAQPTSIQPIFCFDYLRIENPLGRTYLHTNHLHPWPSNHLLSYLSTYIHTYKAKIGYQYEAQHQPRAKPHGSKSISLALFNEVGTIIWTHNKHNMMLLISSLWNLMLATVK